MAKSRLPRVRRFVIAYDAHVDTPQHLFDTTHVGCFLPCQLQCVESLFLPDDNLYMSMLTLARPRTKPMLQRCLDTYRQDVNADFACKQVGDHSAGLIVAGVSEMQPNDPVLQSEGTTFADCLSRFQHAKKHNADVIITQHVFMMSLHKLGTMTGKRLDTRLRFTTFFLSYEKNPSTSSPHAIFDNVCFHSIRIKSIQTVTTPDHMWLSHITLHQRRTQAMVQRCIDEYNFWKHAVAPLNIHRLVTPHDKPLTLQFKHQFWSSSPL